jgi:methylated-DNA-[protein]-cysteine S-methyltransferase
MPFDPFKPVPRMIPASVPTSVPTTVPTTVATTVPTNRAANGAAPLLRWSLRTPIGRIGLCWRPDAPGAAGQAGVLTRVELAADDLAAPAPPPPVAAAFAAYFDQADRPIGLPVALAGTPFQQRVWQAIAAIPAGSTRTYGELAEALGSGPRAVGGACRANPCPLVVPCHRVVGRHGLGGFAGDRDGRLLAIKAWLLRHERASPAA